MRLSASDPCARQPFSCVMTFDPGIRGVPLPRQDLQFFGYGEPYENRIDLWSAHTRFGTVADYVAFYESFMPARGWELVPTESVPVPATDATGQWLVWQRADGVKVGIVVVSIVDHRHGDYLDIAINNQYGMNCVNDVCSWGQSD